MKIGLMRHCKVQAPKRRTFLTSDEFADWVSAYNDSEIVYHPLEKWSATAWDCCYASDMPRAIKSARYIYPDNIRISGLLKEINIAPVFQTRIKLPLALWLVLGRVGWLLEHSSQERKPDTLVRARQIINEIESNVEEDAAVLVVTHGAFMTVLSRELIGKGYAGRRINRPRNSAIYTYVK